MIDRGKVQYNSQHCQASRNIEPGVTAKLTLGADERRVLVKGLSAQKPATSLAQQLYKDSAKSIK